MTSEEIIFHIILHGGNARSLAMEAVSLAKNGNFDEAREKLKKASEEISEAHKTQTSLIQKEAEGEKTDVSLLLVHAQDHLMNALTIQDFAKEFVELYEKLFISGGVKL
ncbi:PTS lactose/cellobiose transporter subunit IIA [Scopulibacillus cellulosilyticus]|uniref:PTS lactose/cellobiose transporter subunit IIA n=1 Tax=Scopulibacillus cellulosilyticus TaxID=2665665 RepID=A0ABW2Q0G2_9BACL